MTGVAVCKRFALLFFVSLASLPGFAATSGIRQPIDESNRVALAGNVHPLANFGNDRGPVNPSLPATRMMLVLKRSASQDADLRQLLSQLRDPSSPNYHKWLTPAKYAERFGISEADAQTLRAWLEGHGFTVGKVGAARTTIEFSGTVGQLQQAFHTSIHRYAVGNEEHLANANDPEIPAALSPVISGIVGLNDFFPKTAAGAAARGVAAKQPGSAKPQFTTAAGGNFLYVGPGDAATIYDAPNALNSNFKGTQSYTGSGETIAVVSDANIDTADVDAYRSFFGLPTNTPRVIIDGNDPGIDTFSTGDTQKALMDVEVAGALAPNANVILYTARNTTLVSGLFLAIARAVDDNLADIIQIGFSACEKDLGYSGNIFVADEWVQAAAEGVTIMAASGDSGSAACDLPANDASAQQGFAVNGFASTADDIAVGGTDFDGLPGNFSHYVASNGLASGYIPELPWNDSVAIGGNGALSANTPFKDPNGSTNTFAGGGGVSSCANYVSPTSTVCGGHTKPSWQTAANLNIPPGTARILPDVAIFAGSGQYGAAWAVCGNDYDSAGNLIADCAANSGGGANIQGLGGTSASAAAFAGILALVGQSQSAASGTTRLGQANFVLYNLANQTALYSGVFHDIANGNNSVVCQSGSPNCGSNGFLAGYNAGANYDQATGLGSVDASALIANWSKASYAPSTTTLTIDGGTGPITITHGQSINLFVQVAGNSGTPTGPAGVVGTVDETSNTYGDDVAFAGLLSNGALSMNDVPSAPGGTFQTWATYGGDLTYAASVSPKITLTVKPEDSTLSLALYLQNATPVTAANPTFPYGTYLSVDATPKGLSKAGIATGTVTFADNGTTLLTRADNLNRKGFAEYPEYYWTGGTHSIAASYSGDNSFNPSSTTTPLVFTISQAATTLTVSVAPSSLINGAATVTGTVAATIANNGAVPTGTVTLTDSTNGTALGSATLVQGSAKSTFTLTIQAAQLALGANILTADYGGDTNYSGSSGTTTATRLAAVATALTMVANPASLFTGSATLSGVVTPLSTGVAASPFGLVTLVNSTNGAQLGTAPLVAGAVTNGIATATFTLAVNSTSLTLGANTLAATYAGDGNYAGSSGTTTVTLSAAPPNPAFTISATGVTIATPGQTTGNTSTITIAPENGFTGQVNLTAAPVSAPLNAISPATLTLSSPSVAIAGTGSATATATIATTALTYAMQRPEDSRPRPDRWYEAGGATLAGLLLTGIPARRRGWRAMLGLLLFAAAGSIMGCGVHLNPIKTAPTTPGTYVFSVTGVDQATGLLKATGNITVTVQ
jgi:hypothetical protein